jgi:hypothetical protein
MKKLIQGKELKVLLIALIVIGLGIVTYGISVIVIKNKSANKKSPSIIEYRNGQYGFSFSLPESWKGYSIVEDKWEGTALGGDVTVEQGPTILIRHPQWTLVNPRQDIPIMVFSLNQWSSLQLAKFHIGAAPFGPQELGRNSNYVFALPARYDYAFLTGFEEVEQILENNPLQAF